MSEEKKNQEHPDDATTKYYCLPCGFVYDPAHGDPEAGVAPGTSFADVPDDEWICPVCGATKDLFEPLD